LKVTHFSITLVTRAKVEIKGRAFLFYFMLKVNLSLMIVSHGYADDID